MIDPIVASRIGRRHAFRAIAAGLGIAYVILALSEGLLWIFRFRYAPTLLLAALVLSMTAYVVGGWTGRLVLLRHFPPLLAGPLSGFLMTGIATGAGSLIGFVGEGLSASTNVGEAAADYLVKPLLMIWLYGSIPICLTGLWYGLAIKRSGTRSQHTAGVQP